MRSWVAEQCGVPKRDVRGFRNPYLEVGCCGWLVAMVGCWVGCSINQSITFKFHGEPAEVSWDWAGGGGCVSGVHRRGTVRCGRRLAGPARPVGWKLRAGISLRNGCGGWCRGGIGKGSVPRLLWEVCHVCCGWLPGWSVGRLVWLNCAKCAHTEIPYRDAFADLGQGGPGASPIVPFQGCTPTLAEPLRMLHTSHRKQAHSAATLPTGRCLTLPPDASTPCVHLQTNPEVRKVLHKSKFLYDRSGASRATAAAA